MEGLVADREGLAGDDGAEKKELGEDEGTVKKIGETAAARAKETNPDVEKKPKTPEEMTARMQEIGEAIFSIFYRTEGVLMILGGTQHLFNDPSLKRLAWRGDFREPWTTVIVERIKLDDKNFQYRIHKPHEDDLGGMAYLTKKPDLTKSEVVADSHAQPSEDSEEEDDELLRVRQANLEWFEEISKIAARGSEKTEDIIELAAIEKANLVKR